MGSFATNYEEIAAVLLFVIGMSNLVFQPNLLKKIIGLDIMDSAVYLFLASFGFATGMLPSSPFVYGCSGCL